LRALSERDRSERLLTFISRETKEVFGMPQTEPLDEKRGLVEMGMDSLMAVILQNELQAAFGVQLSATLVLDYPSIASLARFLDEKLFVKSSQRAAAPPPEPLQPSQADLTSVAEMNDNETDAALAAELAMIQQKLGVY
jgi:acyl carrier protein